MRQKSSHFTSFIKTYRQIGGRCVCVNVWGLGSLSPNGDGTKKSAFFFFLLYFFIFFVYKSYSEALGNTLTSYSCL